MKPLRFTDGNVGWVYSSVKNCKEEDVREFVLKNARQFKRAYAGNISPQGCQELYPAVRSNPDLSGIPQEDKNTDKNQ